MTKADHVVLPRAARETLERLKLAHTPPSENAAAKWAALDFNKAVAVAGSRTVTRDGLFAALETGAMIADSGAALVTGGARGVESLAIEAALDCGGMVVVVLPCGLGVAWPPENAALYERVVAEGGMLVSSWAPTVRPTPSSFAARNDAVLELAGRLIVVQADEQSGSMRAAHRAASKNMPIQAVRGLTPNELAHPTFDVTWLDWDGKSLTVPADR